MRLWRSGSVLFVAMVLLSLAGAAAQKITTTVEDKGYDFKTAKKYAWGTNRLFTKQSRESNAYLNQKIIEEVNKNLAKKGFVLVETKPDFYISYDGGSVDPLIAVEGSPVDQPPISTASTGPVFGIQENVWYSVDGHLTFHVADAATKKPVWTAEATKKIRDPQKAMKDMPEQIEDVVQKVFKDFPPKKK